MLLSIVTGLLELCLEVRDRSADDLSLDDPSTSSSNPNPNPNPLRRHEASKRDLFKRCNSDVLVVLDHLRANVRIQLAFKEDYEKELKGTLDRRRDAHVVEMSKMMNERSHLNDLLSQSQARIEENEREVQNVNDNKNRVTKGTSYFKRVYLCQNSHSDTETFTSTLCIRHEAICKILDPKFQYLDLNSSFLLTLLLTRSETLFFLFFFVYSLLHPHSLSSNTFHQIPYQNVKI